MFALCGGAVIVGLRGGGRRRPGRRPAGWNAAMGPLDAVPARARIIGTLAAITTWIAFGPGPRAFTVMLPFVGRGPGDETVGRAVFGFGAVLMWVFLVVFVVVSVQRLRGSK
jgi:hypothetical protein